MQGRIKRVLSPVSELKRAPLLLSGQTTTGGLGMANA